MVRVNNVYAMYFPMSHGRTNPLNLEAQRQWVQNGIPLEDEDAEVPQTGALNTNDVDELESRSRSSVVDPDEIELF